jgi:hypothetical protein
MLVDAFVCFLMERKGEARHTRRATRSAHPRGMRCAAAQKRIAKSQVVPLRCDLIQAVFERSLLTQLPRSALPSSVRPAKMARACVLPLLLLLALGAAVTARADKVRASVACARRRRASAKRWRGRAVRGAPQRRRRRLLARAALGKRGAGCVRRRVR